MAKKSMIEREKKRAKIVEKYVHKGDKIYVEGRIRYRSYDDQRGVKRYVTEILADNLELLTPKSVSTSTEKADMEAEQDNMSMPNDPNKLPF